MNRDTAKQEARRVWNDWGDRNRRDIKAMALAMVFFRHLEQNHSILLSFPTSEDRYQIVKGWVEGWIYDDKGGV